MFKRVGCYIVPRIDIRNITEEELRKLDNQVKKLGLSSRSDYIRLIINLDAATGLMKLIKGEK